MKCQICKNKTTWDESFGYNDFIVCPRCYEAIKIRLGTDNFETMNIISVLGDIRRKNQKKKTD